jgi:dipeptidyl aminopeptidase/acylaminoacyl peptidase
VLLIEEIHMHFTRFAPSLLIAGLAAGPLAAAEGTGWTPELAFKVKRVGTVRVSPDGRHVAYVVGTPQMEGEKSEWLSHVHVARGDGSGGFQLTQGDKSATSPAWSPDGKWIAFLSSRPSGAAADRAGAPGTARPTANLWRIRSDGGEAEPLTDEKGGISAFQWSPDATRIAFLKADPKSDAEEKADKEKRDARVVDENHKMIRLYVIPVEKDAEGKRPVKKLTAGDFSIGDVTGPGDIDWSPDGRSIAFTHRPSPKVDDWPKDDVSVVDVASGAIRPLAATGAAETQPTYSPDGQWIALNVSNDPPTWRRRARVVLFPAQGGTPKPLAETRDSQPNILGWTKDGRVLFSETYNTVNRVGALPASGGPAVDLTPADLMVDGPALNASRTHIGFASQSAEKPAEAFAAALAPFTPTQASKVQELPDVALGRTEVITWRAPDGKTIEGLLTYPAGYKPGARVPLLVVVHGGPAGVFVRSFTGTPGPYPIAVFASRGYAVLRCNVRGSSGYGFEFRNANYKDWGGGDYRDILSGVDSLVARGIADPERLGVMGWSYGGFMTSWVITQTKRFKAASVGAGVTNLMSFTGTADIPSFLPDYFGGEFWNVFEDWRTHSAMFNIKGVTTPTLIQHGEADLRVPISQGYELYNALKRQGVPVKMVTYPRQPHGIQEPKLLKDAMERNLEWFDRWVMGKGEPVTSGSR